MYPIRHGSLATRAARAGRPMSIRRLFLRPRDFSLKKLASEQLGPTASPILGRKRSFCGKGRLGGVPFLFRLSPVPAPPVCGVYYAIGARMAIHKGRWAAQFLRLLARFFEGKKVVNIFKIFLACPGSFPLFSSTDGWNRFSFRIDLKKKQGEGG